MIGFAATLVSLLAVASAQSYYGGYGYIDGSDYYYPSAYLFEDYAYDSDYSIDVVPTVSSISEHYDSPYYYITYYSHHKAYVYEYETCSSPPSSIEICLSSIFTSIESALASIEATLKSAEATIVVEMHNEHAGLTYELSWVSLISSIASQVSSAVDFLYEEVSEQVHDLQAEYKDVIQIYEQLEAELQDIVAHAEDVIEQRNAIYQQYQKVEVAKWSLYVAISYINSEKIIVQEEEAEIEQVVGQLYAEIEHIESEIAQLNKRQSWLLSQEDKLSINIHGFQQNIVQFRDVESDLVNREYALYIEQERLLYEANNVLQALAELKVEYANVVEYLRYIEIDEVELESLEEEISQEAQVFVSAYEEFTCEDSLLYYEACSSPVTVAVAAAPAAPAPKP